MGRLQGGKDGWGGRNRTMNSLSLAFRYKEKIGRWAEGHCLFFNGARGFEPAHWEAQRTRVGPQKRGYKMTSDTVVCLLCRRLLIDARDSEHGHHFRTLRGVFRSLLKENIDTDFPIDGIQGTPHTCARRHSAISAYIPPFNFIINKLCSLIYRKPYRCIASQTIFSANQRGFLLSWLLSCPRVWTTEFDLQAGWCLSFVNFRYVYASMAYL